VAADAGGAARDEADLGDGVRHVGPRGSTPLATTVSRPVGLVRPTGSPWEGAVRLARNQKPGLRRTRSGSKLGAADFLPEVVGLLDHDHDTLECSLRLHDAVSDELPRAEGVLAKDAFARREVRRLMTIPGVGWVIALSVIAVIGDVARFPSARLLVGYSDSIGGCARPAIAPPGPLPQSQAQACELLTALC
jgi:Transposase IS116/IS110/IS902 family